MQLVLQILERNHGYSRCIAEEPTKILTTLAIIVPISPINKPNFVRSLFVVYPYRLIAPNVLAIYKKTLAIEV